MEGSFFWKHDCVVTIIDFSVLESLICYFQAMLLFQSNT